MPGLPSAQIPLCERAVQAAGEQPLAAVHRVLRPRHAAQARLLPSRQPLQGSAAVLHFFVPYALHDDTCLPWQQISLMLYQSSDLQRHSAGQCIRAFCLYAVSSP